MTYIINSDFCSCCGICKVYCPAGAIRFKGSKYWIDPVKCTDCGTCAALCHNSIISNPDKPDPEPVKHALHELTADLVVLGAGGAGLIAAVKAATAGAGKVIVLEKAKNIGGNTYYAGGFRVSYSKLEKEAGLPDKRDRKLLDFMMNILWQADHHVARSILYATGNLADWMMAECGAEHDFAVKQSPPFGFNVPVDESTSAARLQSTELSAPPTTKLRGPDASIGPGKGGSYIVDKMYAMCKKLNIPILTQHRAVKLLLDKNGKISGVLADDPGGQTQISCKAVILACGGFSYNDDLLLRARPDFYDVTEETIHKFSIPTCTGDGILMAEKAGAKIDMENVKVAKFGPAHHPFAYSVLCMTREPDMILVNKYGKRWACEFNNTMVIRHLFEQQPGGWAYYVADSNMVDMLAKRLIGRGRDGEQGTTSLRRYKEEIEEELALGKPAKRADTLEKLAEHMRIPVADFVDEINKYNKFCRQGFDEDFFKDPGFLTPIVQPPFYAFFAKRFHENASGGVTIDSLARVVSTQGSPIAGLYACGDTARGIRVKGDVGIDDVESFISDLTSAVGTGYMAGEAATEYIKSV